MTAIPARHREVVDTPKPTRQRAVVALAMMTGALLVLLGAGLAVLTPANAAPPSVGLGTADPFAILAGSEITNTGPSVINGDVGVDPGSAITGFPPGTVNGTIHAADAVAQQAKDDLVTAYNDAAGRPSTAVATELGGRTFLAGVYSNSTELGLTGTVTLDAQNDPSSVWIFQAGSTLITASNSTVALTNGADPCNVFWQVGSSATLGTGTTFVGTILALTSITVQSGTTVEGRALARDGAVTLDNNVFNLPECAPPTTTAPTTTAPTTTAPTTTAPTTTSTTPTTTAPTTTAPTTTAPTTTAPTTTAPTTTTSTTPTTTSSGGGGGGNGGGGNGGGGNGGGGNGGGGNGNGNGGGGGGNGGGGGGNGGGNGGGAGNGNGNGANGGGGGLAYTGTSLPIVPLGSIGAGVVLIGAAVLLMTRRPRPKHA